MSVDTNDPFEFPIKRCRGKEFPVCEYNLCCPKSNITDSEFCESEGFSGNFENEEDYIGSEEDKTNYLYVKGYPFYKPTKREVSPLLSLYQNFSKEQYCTRDTSWLSDVIRKEKWNYRIENVCQEILLDILKFSNETSFSITKGLASMEIFFSCFKFFMLGPAISLDELCEYFRQTLLLYAVRDIPASMDIFSPMECLSIAKKFYDIFESNFTILQYLLIPEITIHIPIEYS